MDLVYTQIVIDSTIFHFLINLNTDKNYSANVNGNIANFMKKERYLINFNTDENCSTSGNGNITKHYEKKLFFIHKTNYSNFYHLQHHLPCFKIIFC